MYVRAAELHSDKQQAVALYCQQLMHACLAVLVLASTLVRITHIVE